MQKSAILIPKSVQIAKYLHAERSLLMRKSLLVSKQITYTRVQARSIVSSWAVGDYCISLKVLKSPHKKIYSFNLTMLWLSLSSSLSSAKYFHLRSVHTITVAMWASAPCCIDSMHVHVVLGRFPIPSRFCVWGLPRTTRNSYRGTVLNQCNMALEPTRPQLWCAYCMGGNI